MIISKMGVALKCLTAKTLTAAHIKNYTARHNGFLLSTVRPSLKRSTPKNCARWSSANEWINPSRCLNCSNTFFFFQLSELS